MMERKKARGGRAGENAEKDRDWEAERQANGGGMNCEIRVANREKHHYAARMRTTLMIHDELYSEVKRVAAGRRTSVSQVVNDALRREVSGNAQRMKVPLVRIPVFGPSTDGSTDTSPAEFDALLNEDAGMR